MCRNQLWKLIAVSLALVVAADCSGYNSTGPNYPPAAKADLIVSDSVTTATPAAGMEFFFIFHVRNLGPDVATSVTLTDALPAGMGFNFGAVNGLLAACGVQNAIVSCDIGTLASGADARIIVSVNAPVTAGSFSSVVTAGSAVSDPLASNNSVTIPVQVAVALASCTLPAGQTTLDGLVMWKGTNSSGLFENFGFSAAGVTYTVLTNFYDGSAPLTTVINLDCKQSPVQFTQVGNFVNVTGTVGSAILPGSAQTTPVIYASVVQVLTHKDRP
jgi:uncharacterized repeat protein (TIGR01451 family)